MVVRKHAGGGESCETEDESNGKLARRAQRQNRRFDRVRDDLMRSNSLSSLYVHVRDEKIVDRILQEAEIVEPASDHKSADKAPKKKKAAKKTTKTAEKKTTTKKKSGTAAAGARDLAKARLRRQT